MFRIKLINLAAILTTVTSHSNPIFQRVFNQQDSSSLADRFFGHAYQENYPQQEEPVYYLNQDQDDFYDNDYSFEDVFRVNDETVLPHIYIQEKFIEDEIKETADNSGYSDFKVLPHFEHLGTFHKIEEDTVTELEPVKTVKDVLEKEATNVVQYSGFKLLPHFDYLNTFHKLVKVEAELGEILPENNTIVQLEPTEGPKSAYSGFKILPHFEYLNTFHKVVETFPQEMNATEIPTIETKTKKTDYSGFKLLPHFETIQIFQSTPNDLLLESSPTATIPSLFESSTANTQINRMRFKTIEVNQTTNLTPKLALKKVMRIRKKNGKQKFNSLPHFTPSRFRKVNPAIHRNDYKVANLTDIPLEPNRIFDLNKTTDGFQNSYGDRLSKI